jgi:serine phosphatase RsbU (regulator of sigma subunit)
MVLAVLLATGLGGLWCGLSAAALSATILGFVFIAPDGTGPVTSRDIVAIIVYSAVVLAVCISTHAILRRARAEASATAALQVELKLEREAVLTMQTALLPLHPPVPEGFEVAFRYRGADEVSALGGDWYAVVPVGPRQLGLAIGDVVGHGTQSVALMAEIRFALRTLAAEGGPPAELLGTLNRLVRKFEQGAMCTALYGIWDADTNCWRQAVAGHPPPVVRTDDSCRLLEETKPGPPLGVEPEARYPTTEIALEPNSMLILYTDGLIERRGEPLDVSFERLCATVKDTPQGPERLCDDLLGALVPTRAQDDVAIVAARASRPGA